MIVARGEGKDSNLELLVVPNVFYDEKTPDVPPKMSWEHLLLASVHNTKGEAHKHHTDMALELSELVTWSPPEDLNKDCREWCKRYKLCTAVHGRAGTEAGHRAIMYS